MKIKRARGHRLYTQDGQRIIDLSMGFGRGVLGHRPNGVSLALKNTIEKGLYSEYDSIYLTRLTKELKNMFPNHKNITFLESQNILKDTFNKIVDPVEIDFDNTQEYDIAYWRPFLPTPFAEKIIVLYPMPGMTSTTIIVSKSPLEIESTPISPVLLSGILKSLYEYKACQREFKREKYLAFSNILNTRVIPPYLIFDTNDIEYSKLLTKALENGILLNNRGKINVLPMEYSPGELQKIISILGKN